MKESILDVLLYLFEHYFTNEAIDVDGEVELTGPAELVATVTLGT